jgi:hypothetical protein
MQAVFRGAYWLWFWSLLQREDTSETIRSASKAPEIVTLDIVAKNGWRNNNRLCFLIFLILCVLFPFNLCILGAYT